MKFLVDNQLPGALAVYLRKKGTDSEHVLDAGLGEATDAELCRYATALLEAFEQVWPRLEASLSAGERVVEIRS